MNNMSVACILACLEEHRAELIKCAQETIDNWDWLGGGACDEVACVIAGVLEELEGIAAYPHGQDGGDHTWVVIPVPKDKVIEVDIPWHLYEYRVGHYQYEPTHQRLGVRDIHFTVVDLDVDLLGLECEQENCSTCSLEICQPELMRLKEVMTHGRG